MTSESNSWRISYKVGDFHGTLASCTIEGYTQFIFRGRDGDVTFDAQEAAFLHQALGAMLSGGLSAPMPSPIAAAQPAPPIVKDKAKPLPEKTSSNAGRRWTDEDDANLKAAYAAKKTIDELSATFSRSPAAIVSRLLKHDLVQVVRKPDGTG